MHRGGSSRHGEALGEASANEMHQAAPAASGSPASKTPEEEMASASMSASATVSTPVSAKASPTEGLGRNHPLLHRHPQWGDVLGNQLIAASPAPIPAAPLDVLQGARRCGRRFMRVFSDNLHNCYVDLLDSKNMMEFRARALKRRICRGSRKEPDNELYRSNSFKFERFERLDDPNDKQIALCDDYSLPVDFVNKRRTLRPWRPLSACEPLGRFASIELLDTYCDPRDSKAYLVPGEDATAKVYTSPDREYTHPYADGTRAGARFCKATKAAKVAARAAAVAAATAAAAAVVAASSATATTTINLTATATSSDEDADEDEEDGDDEDDDEEDALQPSAPPAEDDDDGAYEDVIVQELQEKYILELQRQQQHLLQQAAEGVGGVEPAEAAPGGPSPRCPYYYADLLLPRPPPREHRKRGTDTRRYRKSASVDGAQVPDPPSCGVADGRRCLPARGWSLTEDGGGMSPSYPVAQCPHLDLGDDMSRRLHLYETAFDSRVAAPLDRRGEDVSNHAILAVSPAVSVGSQDGTPSGPSGVPGVASLNSTLAGLQLGSGSERSDSPLQALQALRGYSPPPPGSAPSSAPLPAKFHGHGSQALQALQARSMLSIRSAPSAPHLSTKTHAVKEIKGRPHVRPNSLAMTASSSTASSADPVAATASSSRQDFPLILARPSRARTILEFKGRPLSGRADRPLSLVAPRRPKFSSTESMATSSSGGSLESVRSSTSEGERSSSSDGRPGSSSLSSHSEDSAVMLHGPSPGPTSRLYGHTSAKLHILSPISDKSSLEPCSETSDNNRNNNSELASPEPGSGLGTPTGSTHVGTTPGTAGSAAGTPTGNAPTASIADQNASKVSRTRRTPNNRNLIALSLHGITSVQNTNNKNGDGEVPGSDSGISVDGSNLRWANNCHQELEHLPFDMPKLRRRRANLIMDTTTSGSATSVEAGSAGSGGAGHEDLPFDMPKLRRKLRAQVASLSSESSSQSSEPQDNAQDRDVEQMLRDLPFDMPKLRKKQVSRSSESSSASQSDPSVFTGLGAIAAATSRPSLSLNLAGGGGPFGGCGSQQFAENFGSGLASAFAPMRASCGTRGRPGLTGLSLTFGSNSINAPSAHIDTALPLERQGWYLGAISRVEAERLLRQAGEGSYLVRNSESTRQDFSLSLKSARGFMHMRIQKDENGRFILGQFSRPFESVPEMIRHFSVNRLPIRGAEHMCLLHPVIQPLL